MAVGKSKKSRACSKKGRNHYTMATQTICEEVASGEMHLRHNISPNGYYRGQQVIQKAPVESDADA